METEKRRKERHDKLTTESEYGAGAPQLDKNSLKLVEGHRGPYPTYERLYNLNKKRLQSKVEGELINETGQSGRARSKQRSARDSVSRDKNLELYNYAKKKQQLDKNRKEK